MAWRPHLDRNGDGKIDWKDVVVFFGAVEDAADAAAELAASDDRLSKGDLKKVEPLKDYTCEQTRQEWTDITGAKLEKASEQEKQELLRALDTLKGDDRVGAVATLLTLTGAAAAGTAASGVIAGAAGATTTTLFGTVLGWMGVTVLAATPIGWIVGCGLAGGAVGFILVRMLKSGERANAVRRRVETQIRERMGKLHAPKPEDPAHVAFLRMVRDAVDQDMMHPSAAARVVAAVESGAFNLDVAAKRVHDAVESRRLERAERERAESAADPAHEA